MQVQTHGKDIAVFGTNLSMQEPLIRAPALDAGCMFPEALQPWALMGYPGALGIDVEGMSGDMKGYHGRHRRKLSQRAGQDALQPGLWPQHDHYQSLAELAFRL